MIEPDRLYTVNEAAAFLRCGRSNVYDLLNSKRLARVCVGANGGCSRVRGRDITSFIDGATTGGPRAKFELKHIKVG